MRTRLDWNWEKLDNNTYRAQVFGGWIVRCVGGFGKAEVVSVKEAKNLQLSESMVFVSDRDHQWTINPPPKETEKKPSIAKDF